MSYDDKEKQMDDYDTGILAFFCEKLVLVDVETRKQLEFVMDKKRLEESIDCKDFSKVGRIRFRFGNKVIEFSKIREESLQS